MFGMRGQQQQLSAPPDVPFRKIYFLIPCGLTPKASHLWGRFFVGMSPTQLSQARLNPKRLIVIQKLTAMVKMLCREFKKKVVVSGVALIMQRMETHGQGKLFLILFSVLLLMMPRILLAGVSALSSITPRGNSAFTLYSRGPVFTIITQAYYVTAPFVMPSNLVVTITTMTIIRKGNG